jgi:hypothetical protein
MTSLRFFAAGAALLSILSSSGYGQALVHRWSFENNFNDSSSSGNTGTPTGAPTFVAGKFGAAVSLASPNDGVNVDFGANNLPLQGVDSWSMSLWANFATAPGALEYLAGFGIDDNWIDPIDVGAARGVISFGGEGGNNFYFWGGAADFHSGAGYEADSQWHMYTLTYDAPATTMRAYKDGSFVASGSVTLANAFDEIHVGNPSNWNSDFDGSIDEFAIFNGQLSEPQIGGLFFNNNINQPVVLDPTFQINRDTGNITLNNDSSFPIEVLGYTINSPSGALNPVVWDSIAGRFDGPPSGDGSIDANNQWTVFTNTANQFSIELSEGVPGTDGGTISVGKVVNFANAWIANPTEDVTIDILLDDGLGTIKTIPAEFVGNGGDSYAVGDLNTDGLINAADWTAFRTTSVADLSAALPVQAYLGGDLNGDGRKRIEDFDLFAEAYDANNGVGAFAALTASVPEPSAFGLFASAAAALCVGSRTGRRLGARGLALFAVSLLAWTSQPAYAALQGYYQLNDNANEATGNNINLNLVGGASFDGSVHPGLGTALATDGIDDGAIGPNFNKIQTDDVTLVAWVYANSTTNVWETIAKQWGDATAGQFHFGLGPAENNTLNNFYLQGGGGAANDVSPADIPVGQWIHTAFVLDSAAGAHRLYINGQVVTTGAYVGTLGSKTGGATGFGIGIKPVDDGSAPDLANSPGPWDGLIDDVGIYDNALTTVAINQIYQNGLAGIQIDGTTRPYISLEVNRSTGLATLKNTTSGPVAISAYQISSLSGSLNAASLNSIAGETGFPVGNGSGNGWETDGANGSSQVLEAFLTGTSSFGVGSISLGNIYAGSGVADEDLVLHYRTAGGGLIKSVTTFIGAASLDGDYNDDGVVNGVDLTVWKNSFGQAGANLPADGNSSGVVDGHDFLLWQRQFGQSNSATSSAASVPEPASIVAAIALLLPIVCRRGRSTRPRS